MHNEPEEQPLSPTHAGIGCGVLAGASGISLLFFAQGVLAPRLEAALGLDLSGSRWIIAAILFGVVLAVVTGLAARRALDQMPGAPR
mgnify:CR=1 FL=1